jgi:hypothetical protein
MTFPPINHPTHPTNITDPPSSSITKCITNLAHTTNHATHHNNNYITNIALANTNPQNNTTDLNNFFLPSNPGSQPNFTTNNSNHPFLSHDTPSITHPLDPNFRTNPPFDTTSTAHPTIANMSSTTQATFATLINHPPNNNPTKLN